MAHVVQPDLMERVDSLIERGRFAGADDALEQAVDLLENFVAYQGLKLAISVGADQADRGLLIERTPAWSEARMERAKHRLASGDRPHPDVCP